MATKTAKKDEYEPKGKKDTDDCKKKTGKSAKKPKK
jgi:hypothetical protein